MVVANNATMDCYRKKITFKPLGVPEFVFQGDHNEALVP